MRFKWEDSLFLDVKVIDDEHKLLIDQANVLFDALGDPKKSALVIIETMDFLAEYVIKHFDSEEKLQKKYHYPNYKEHHGIHEDFKNEINSLKIDIETNGLSTSKKLIINKTLISWLQHHIGIEDKKLANHILSQR